MNPTLITIGLASVFTWSLFGQAASEPKELSDLRASFEKARTAAVSPLEKKYQDALLVMKDRLTKKGDLEGALAVQAELSKLQPALASPQDNGKLRLARIKTIDEFMAWLITTSWKNENGSFLRFPNKGTVELTRATGEVIKYPTTVEKVGIITWTYSTGGQDVMVIAPDLKEATSKNAGTLSRIEK